MRLRIFHVPSHLSYVAKLVGSAFAPVPSPTGRALRMNELAAWRSWDFFDVLHLHTVELATSDDVEQIATRAVGEHKRLVFTAHDLVPNLEADHAAFDRKTALAVSRAAAVVTLTQPAARTLARRVGVWERAVRAIPHGAAVPLSLVGRGNVGQGAAMFGALRPNRDLIALVRAWTKLPNPRPPLRVLLRSLTTADRERYASVLTELERVRRTEPELTITTTADVVPSDDLVSWCRRSSVLVLPYRRITHSGQLELARDLGLGVLAPDIPTLRAQLAHGPQRPTVWFPPEALDEAQCFAGCLQRALSLPYRYPTNPSCVPTAPVSTGGFSLPTMSCTFTTVQRRCEVDVHFQALLDWNQTDRRATPRQLHRRYQTRPETRRRVRGDVLHRGLPRADHGP